MFTRRARFLASLALMVGLLTVAASSGVVAGTKDNEAKKYTELLQKSKDPKVRLDAIEKIGELAQINKKLGTPAVPYIKDALSDKDTEIRKAAAKAYGRCDPDDADAVKTLVDLMKNDKEDAVKMSAAFGLQSMGEKAKVAVPDMLTVAKSLKNDKDSKQLKRMAATIKGTKNK
ncbi:MAG: HEAT repeat domain-containing protein [Gemmataceae bacterium]